MGVFIAIVVMAALAAVPIVIVFAVGSLAIFIWSWGRIGRYFVNFARWLGDWRNFVPLSILGTLITIVLLLLAFVLLPQVRIIWIVLLVMHLVVTLVCLVFVMIAWIVWLCQWFWPQYRRWLWGVFAWLFGRKRPSRARPIRGPPAKPSKPSTGAPPERRVAKKRSILGSFWGIMLGKPPQTARVAQPVEGGTAPNVQPAKKESRPRHSWFASFVALMLGKPSHPTKQKSPTIKFETTEQAVDRSEGTTLDSKTDTAAGPVPLSPIVQPRSKPGRTRSGLLFLWSAILGRPSGSTRPKIKPVKTQTTDRVPTSSDSTAGVANTDTRSGAPDAATASGTSRKVKITRPDAPGDMWTTIMGGATSVVGSVFSGVRWTAHKMGEGIEWIRVRLNLD